MHTPVRARFALVVPLANSSVPSSFHCVWVSSTQLGNRLELYHVGGVLFALPSKLVKGVEEYSPPVGYSFLCCFRLLSSSYRPQPDAVWFRVPSLFVLCTFTSPLLRLLSFHPLFLFRYVPSLVTFPSPSVRAHRGLGKVIGKVIR